MSAGAIAGGVIGGVAIIAIIAVAIVLYRRRKSVGLGPIMFYSRRSSQANERLPFHTAETTSISQNSSSQNLVSAPRTPIPVQRHDISDTPVPVTAPVSRPAEGSSLHQGAAGSNQLTDEQVEFVRNLYSQAAPAQALARKSSSGHPEDINSAHRRSMSESSDAPPSYHML